MDLAHFRKEYSSRGLKREEMKENPVEQFGQWFQQALSAKVYEPNAMSLATVDNTGMPLQRIVLLKHFDDHGFVFFSNYESRKGRQITDNPKVSLLFPWITLERQIIIQGIAIKSTEAESLAYFHSRPRESQLGAWASNQSEVIASRGILVSKLAEIEERFGPGEIPLPPCWGGYRVVPETLEFWQGGPARLHDRFLYRRNDTGWTMERLAP